MQTFKNKWQRAKNEGKQRKKKKKLRWSFQSSPFSHNRCACSHSQPLLSHLPSPSSFPKVLSKIFPLRSMAEWDPFKWRERRERTLWHQPCPRIIQLAAWPSPYLLSLLTGTSQQLATRGSVPQPGSKSFQLWTVQKCKDSVCPLSN